MLFIYNSEHYGLIFGPYGCHIIFTRYCKVFSQVHFACVLCIQRHSTGSFDNRRSQLFQTQLFNRREGGTPNRSKLKSNALPISLLNYTALLSYTTIDTGNELISKIAAENKETGRDDHIN